MAAPPSTTRLFVCAGRLRRCVPRSVEMGRLGEDGFLLLVPQRRATSSGWCSWRARCANGCPGPSR